MRPFYSPLFFQKQIPLLPKQEGYLHKSKRGVWKNTIRDYVNAYKISERCLSVPFVRGRTGIPIWGDLTALKLRGRVVITFREKRYLENIFSPDAFIRTRRRMGDRGKPWLVSPEIASAKPIEHFSRNACDS